MTIKILVADDSADIQRFVGLAFSDEDAIVESVSDGIAALDAVRNFEPDVVLADVSMPGCNGYEICAGIKEDPELADTAVILLAGTFEPFDESEVSRVRCNGHLTKPLDTSELIQTVFAVAEDRQQMRQVESETEIDCPAAQDDDVGEQDLKVFRFHNLVSPEVCDSFLSSDRILDLYDSDQLEAAKAAMTASMRKTELQAQQDGTGTSPSTVDVIFSENTLNRIVDSVMRRLSAEAIREVAWEIVPEISESIIRRTIEEQKNPRG